MTIRSLMIFKTVFDTESFTKAAEQLYLTQSGISHAIRELEEETGTELFERIGRKIRPTRSARFLYQESSELMERYNLLEKRIHHLEEEAPLRIATSITVASFYLAEALRELKKQYPALRMETTVCTASGAVSLLRRGQADLCLTEGILPAGPYIAEPFASCKISAVCVKDYPAKESLFAEELVREDLLLREKGSALREIPDSALLLKGLKAQPLWTSVNSGALLSATRAGLGIALLPERMLLPDLNAGELREILLPDLPRYNSMFSLRREGTTRTKIEERLLDILRTIGADEEKDKLFPGK